MLLKMLLALIHVLSTFSFASAFEPKRIDIESKSQITIGGLFPVHHKGPSETQPCGSILPEKGIQRLEAMLYAIDEINKNSRYWNFDLGAIILDTCASDNFALEQSVQFLHATYGDISSTKQVVGVVGASNSAVSESVANIFRLVKIPQVSYASTSEELDKLHKYPYFFRVVPSDKFQVRVMVDILVAYKWTYVSTVISEGGYGEMAIKTLQGLLANETREDICFAEQVTIPRNPTENDFEIAITQLNKHKKSKVVIVFMNEDKVKRLLTAVRKSNVEANRFVWIGSDGWGAKMNVVRRNERVAEGAITILPQNYPIKGFNEYFWSLKPETNKRNPWFHEFWEHQFNCCLHSNTSVHPHCTGKGDLKQGYHQESLVPMVIDSVNLLAEAIKSVCEENPRYCYPTSDRGTAFRKLVKEEILKTRINSSQGHDMVIKFDKERHIPTFYKIYQYTKTSNGKYAYREIGDWGLLNGTSYELKLHHKGVWKNSTSAPSSACSKSCMNGEERVIKNPHKHCCWECKACGEEEYMTHEQGYCTSCPEGSISTADKTACKSLELDYMGRSLKSPWALVPVMFAILGLICTGIVLVVFLLYQKTPIIMAAGRQLCYVILFGVALCYCFTFVALSKPSELSCGLLRTGMGLGLSFCYAAIFTKTKRISRIFNRSLRINKRPSYISPVTAQLVICSCLILIQVVLTVMWLLVSPPTVKQLLLTRRRAFVAMCGFGGLSVFVALLYNMLLIALCTYYAFKTRNIPENFNESKYISFAMYAACIVWLAFIPIHFSAGQDNKVQSSVLCMCVSMSGTITLACLFLPKVYIVLCKPERNVRYPSSSPNSSTLNISIAPVRFLRSNQNWPATPHRVPMINTELNGRGDKFLTVKESSTSLNFES